jgi:hypothetical protein
VGDPLLNNIQAIPLIIGHVGGYPEGDAPGTTLLMIVNAHTLAAIKESPIMTRSKPLKDIHDAFFHDVSLTCSSPISLLDISHDL